MVYLPACLFTLLKLITKALVSLPHPGLPCTLVMSQELQDTVGQTIGAGVDLTGQVVRAAAPVAQGVIAAVRNYIIITLVLSFCRYKT